MTEEELEAHYRNRKRVPNDWIYPEEKYHHIDKEPWVTFKEAQSCRHEYFLPESSSLNTLAYDCLAKTINQALGFLFFSHHDQISRLIERD